MASLLRRGFATAAKSNKVTIGLIPADGIGREVIPVSHFGRFSTIAVGF
jgi:homoisocitrate dehydrogenase